MMDGEYLLPVNNGHYVAIAFPFSPGYVSDFETGIVVNFDTVTVSFVTPLVKLDALVRGSVVDTAGTPIKGAWVSAGILGPFGWEGPVQGGFDFHDETDSVGKYELDVMGFADRSYWIYADYFAPETGELWVGGRDSVVIHSGDTVLVDLELSPIIYMSEISGYVTLDGEPVAGAEVRVYIIGTDEFFSVFTDENGFYSLGVPNGDYTVCVFIWEYHLVDCGETFVEDFAAAMDFEFGTVDVSPTALLPERFSLYQNHPNPFNPVTTIRYDVPEWSQVRLTVFDLLGKEVKTLVDGTQPAGFHRVTWDGRNHVGQEVATGVYIYQLKTGEFVATKRLILLK